MNEVSLSTDLNVLTAEINSYKQIAGQSIWEIGRRLNYVKENDLARGEFSKWLKKIGINHPEANRMMRVAKELPNSSTLTNLGSTALYLIATLPEEERTKEHVTEKGETKTPDEMTVRELEKLKKEIYRKDQELNDLKNTVSNLKQQEPQVIEKEVIVEKIPDDYKFFKKSAKLSGEIATENEKLKKQIAKTNEELQAKKRIENDELEQAQLKRLERDANISVYKLILNLNDFVKEQAITVYDSQAIAGANQETKEKLVKAVGRTEKLLQEIKKEIGGEVAWVIN